MPQPRPILIASDHAGLALKERLTAALREWGLRPQDLGTNGPESVDYPDFADSLAEAMRRGEADRGVLVCGSGIGIAIAANRHAHIRAAVVWDVTSARLARAHNDANVLALGGRLVGEAVALDCLRTFLDTPYEGGRHAPRVAKLAREKQTA